MAYNTGDITTVGELIAALEHHNPELPVVVFDLRLARPTYTVGPITEQLGGDRRQPTKHAVQVSLGTPIDPPPLPELRSDYPR